MRSQLFGFNVMLVLVVSFKAVIVHSDSESSGTLTEDVTDRNGNKIGKKTTVTKTISKKWTSNTHTEAASDSGTQDLFNRLLKESSFSSPTGISGVSLGNIDDIFKDFQNKKFSSDFFQDKTPAPPAPPPPRTTTAAPPPPPPPPPRTTRPPATPRPAPPPPSRTHSPPAPPPPAPPLAPQCGTVGLPVAPLIIQGDTYTRGDWPWLVALYSTVDGLKYFCSGTLISDRHVVTAAHCMILGHGLLNFGPRDIVVRVGAFNLDTWGDDVQRSLSDAKVHDDYNSTTLANDISIMTFSRPVEFSYYIKPICLWDFDTNLDHIANNVGVVTGWGKDENGLVGRGPPKVTRVPIVTNSTCRASHADFHKFTNNGNAFCGGKQDGTGPCNGDSGGGLYLMRNRRWYIRGLVSLALLPENGLKDHCNLDEYLVFTDVAKFLPWITRIMNR